MAQAFPYSIFVGSDYHDGSIETARRRAHEAGVAERVRFEVAPAAAYAGAGYDLVTMFDCLHDMGDPAGAARHVRGTLKPDGTWMIVEPHAGDRIEENLNPVGRAYYGFSTLLCTPASLSQDVGLALGAQAGQARIGEVVGAGGFTRFRRAAERTFQPHVRGASVTAPARPAGAPASQAELAPLTGPEQTRALYPDTEGYVERDGVRLYYEVYGNGEPTFFLLPTWSIVHSRHWKMQIPYLAHHRRVVTFDGRGNGRSDRPATGYEEAEFAADALAVMDATATGHAVIVSLSLGAQRALLLAAEHPERVDGAVFIAPAVPFAGLAGGKSPRWWGEELGTNEGWAKYNPLLLAAGLPRLPPSSSSPGCSPSRTPQRRPRTASAGAWTRRRRRS